MQFFKTYESFEESDIREKVLRLHKIDKELKEEAVKYLKKYSRAKNGVISELELHRDIIKKCQEKGLPTGFSMGIDKNGYFIHTHRARSKSYSSPAKISVKDIKFIDSTG